MIEKNTGGPAFPTAMTEGDSWVWPGAEGMTKRDYFAAKAMQGDMAAESGGSIVGNSETHEEAAEAYYRIADAMLKARES